MLSLYCKPGGGKACAPRPGHAPRLRHKIQLDIIVAFFIFSFVWHERKASLLHERARLSRARVAATARRREHSQTRVLHQIPIVMVKARFSHLYLLQQRQLIPALPRYTIRELNRTCPELGQNDFRQFFSRRYEISAKEVKPKKCGRGRQAALLACTALALRISCQVKISPGR